VNRFQYIPAALAVCAFCLVISGCGSAGTSGTGTAAVGVSGGANKPLQYAECMRSHGVPNFPDPSPQGGIHITPSSGVNPQSPVFQSAQQACAKLGPGGPGGGISSGQRSAALAFSRCMRAHGVPDFPDPTFQKGGGIFLRVGPGANPQSPAFQRAQTACGRSGP
jgi:hypothetical protein